MEAAGMTGLSLGTQNQEGCLQDKGEPSSELLAATLPS
jgi:hypothetical protein